MTKPRPRTESELVEYVRSSDVRAPEELHRRVESLIEAQSPSVRRRLRADRSGAGGRSRFGLGLAGAVAVAAIAAVAIAVGLSGGGSSTLSLRQASALTQRAATVPAPAENAGQARAARRIGRRRRLPLLGRPLRLALDAAPAATIWPDGRSRRSSTRTTAAGGSAMRSSPAPRPPG